MTLEAAIGALLLALVSHWLVFRLGYDEGRRTSPWLAMLNAERREHARERAELVTRLSTQTEIAHAALQASYDLAQELNAETATSVTLLERLEAQGRA